MTSFQKTGADYAAAKYWAAAADFNVMIFQVAAEGAADVNPPAGT